MFNKAGFVWKQDAIESVFTVVKTVDETVNNSTTFIQDDELFINNLAVGFYHVELRLVTNRGATASTIKHRLQFSGTATWRIAFDLDNKVHATTTESANLSSIALVAGTRAGLFVGHINITAPGDLTYEWAQSALVADDSIVRSGSYLVLTKL